MRKKLTREEILILLENIYNIVKSGLPLDSALRELGRESKGRLKASAEDIATRLQQGLSLSKALEAAATGISRYLLAMMQIGEDGGNLPEVLNDIIKFYHRHLHTHRRIVAASRYPFLILSIAFFFTIIVIVFLLPQIKEVFRQLGATERLPWITLIFLRIGDVLRHYILADILIGIILLTLITNFWTLSIFRGIRSHLELAIPMVGKMVYFDSLSTFSRSLAHLLKRKIPLPNALLLSRLTIRNITFHQPLEKVAEEVGKGKRLSTALMETGIVPSSFAWTIEMSENRGDLEFVLQEVANLYEEKFDNLAQVVFVYFEPLLLIFVGVLIGIIIASFYYPLFMISRLIGGRELGW